MNSTRNKDMIFLFTPSPPLKNYLADVLFIFFLKCYTEAKYLYGLSMKTSSDTF